MKKMTKLAIITGMAVLAAAAANAQTTNVTYNVNVALTGFKQSGDSNAAPVRVTTKDIINALNNIPEGGFAFGRSAKIVAISTQGEGGGGVPAFFVREKVGSETTTTDISSFLAITDASSEVIGRNGVQYGIVTFHFDDGVGDSFTVSGFATLHNGRI